VRIDESPSGLDLDLIPASSRYRVVFIYIDWLMTQAAGRPAQTDRPQQWNFKSCSSTREFEDYEVNLEGV
jgi:hypothetical protein